MHGKYSQENGKYSPIMTIADFQSKFKCISEQVYATVWQDLKSNNNKDRQRVVRSTQQQAHYANATMQSEKAKRTMICVEEKMGTSGAQLENKELHSLSKCHSTSRGDWRCQLRLRNSRGGLVLTSLSLLLTKVPNIFDHLQNLKEPRSWL